jgi:hypothetical protein
MENVKKGNDCFSCPYSRQAPGSAHLECWFDWLKSELPVPRGNEHGIENGWVFFPLNFDPVWILDEFPCMVTDQEADAAKMKNPIETVVAALLTNAFSKD